MMDFGKKNKKDDFITKESGKISRQNILRQLMKSGGNYPTIHFLKSDARFLLT